MKLINRTDDPIADWERQTELEDETLKNLPTCEVCGWKITEEHAYYINDEWVCEECMNTHFRRAVYD